MMTESEQALYEADNPNDFITIGKFCERENIPPLGKKRLVGKLIIREGRKLDDPILGYDEKPTADQLHNPDDLLMMDCWRARRFAEKNRLTLSKS
jgi:hypothetical protein